MTTATKQDEDVVVEPQAAPDNSTEWAAARALATPIVATKATERKRTYDLMKSGAPMYGVQGA